MPWGCATAHDSGTSLLGRRATGTTPTWRPRSTSSTGTGRCVAHGRSDGTTGATGEASCARARAVGIFYRGDKKLPSAEGQNNGLRGVPVIVGSRHGPCSGPGLARHAPRARTRRAWGSGCRVRGPRRIVRSMQGCRERSRESRVTRCGVLGSVGGGYRPCGRPTPSRHARMACAEALGLLQAYGSAPHNPTRRSTDPK